METPTIPQKLSTKQLRAGFLPGFKNSNRENSYTTVAIENDLTKPINTIPLANLKKPSLFKLPFNFKSNNLLAGIHNTEPSQAMTLTAPVFKHPNWK